jgi:hypothetical protein
VSVPRVRVGKIPPKTTNINSMRINKPPAKHRKDRITVNLLGGVHAIFFSPFFYLK